MLDHRLRFRRLVLACLLVGAVLGPAALLTGGSQAHAQALVIAQRLDMSLAALPRYGDAVFRNGQAARAVADELGVDAVDVVPDRVSLVAEPDSIVLAVVGHADDQETATRIADTAADVFVRDLNAAGAGVGEFALLHRAQPSGALDTWDDDAGTWTVAVPVAVAAVLAAGVVLAARARARP